MHGVLAGALEEILGAIEGIEDPQPFSIQRFPGCELLSSGFFAEQSPWGIREGTAEAIEQVLIHREIRRAHRALAAVINAQGGG